MAHLLDILAYTAIAAGIGGIWLLVNGLHGVRRDEHSCCSNCEFDLSGTPDHVSVCTECGADLRKPYAIRLGNLQKRPAWVLWGLLLIAAGLPGATYVVNFKGAKQQINNHAPTSVLVAHVLGTTSPDKNIVDVLVDRIDRDEVDVQDIDALIKHALTTQADQSIEWSPRLGSIVTAAIYEGHASQSEITQYIDHAMRERERLGKIDASEGRIEFIADAWAERCGEGSFYGDFHAQLRFKTVYENATLNGLPTHARYSNGAREGEWDTFMSGTLTTGGITHYPGFHEPIFADFGPGEHTLQLTKHTQVWCTPYRKPATGTAYFGNQANEIKVIDREETLSLEFPVLDES